MSTVPVKVCIHCGEDCSKRARTRDARGRYACKVCYDEAAARQKAAAMGAAGAPGTEPSGPDAMGTFLADAPAPCPSCGSPMRKEAIVCTFCGFNAQTGAAARTRVQRAAEASREKASGERRRFSLPFVSVSPTALLLISFAGVGGLGILADSNPELVIPYYFVAAGYVLATYFATVICAFKDEHPGWGIIGILSFFMACLWLPMLYYVYGVTDRSNIRVAYTVGVLSYIVLGFLVMKHGDYLASLE